MISKEYNMKKILSLSIVFLFTSGFFYQCRDEEPQDAQTGYRDEEKVREKFAEINALLDSAISFAENCEASETFDENQAGFLLNEEEQDSLRTLLAMIHIAKANELAYGLTPDAGGGKSFLWWYNRLQMIDRSLWEAGRYSSRPLEWLRAAKRDKEETEASLGFSGD
jgi:hypothetical protein